MSENVFFLNITSLFISSFILLMCDEQHENNFNNRQDFHMCAWADRSFFKETITLCFFFMFGGQLQ